MSRNDRHGVDLLLVCSSGGHLLQLCALREAWEGLDRAWVSFDKSDVRSLLAGERVVHAHGPTNRNLGNLLRNGRARDQAGPRACDPAPCSPPARASRSHSRGSLACYGARVVYVESMTRIEGPSLSMRLIAPVASRLYVQWPELAPRVRRARFAGRVFGA